MAGDGVERILVRLRAGRRADGLPGFNDWNDLRRSLRTLLSEFSDDPATLYSRRSLILESFLQDLKLQWAKRRTLSLGQRGMVGVTLVIAQGVAASSRYSVYGRPSEEEEDAFAKTVNEVLNDAAVKAMLRSLYQLDGDRKSEAWRSVDWRTLRFHRAGTTSMILRAETRAKSLVVVKLLHFLFQEIRPIADSMAAHYRTVEAVRIDCPYLTQCYGSGRGWVVEEFVDGSTLAAFIEARAENFSSYEERIELFRQTYCAVLAAVANLHKALDGTITHADLSPANIMVQTGGTFPGLVNQDAADANTVRIRLIDLGRNLLASSAIGRVSSPDAHFVAPEVATLSPEGRAEDQRADYYSLGMLVPLCLGISSPQDLLGDRLPDELFVLEPILATVACDLADPHPERRFRLLGDKRSSSADRLSTLRKDLLLVTSALSDGTQLGVRTGIAASTRAAVRLDAREIFHSVWRASKAMRGSSLPLAKENAWFRLWLAVSLVFLFLSLFVLIETFSVDYGASFGFLTAPFVHDLLLNKLGYVINRPANWQARLVGASFAFSCFFYYIFGFSRFTMRRAGEGGYFVVGEWSMRCMTFVVFPFVLVSSVWYPGMWLWFSVAGMAVVGFNNWVVSAQVRSIVRRCKLVQGSEQSIGLGRNSSYWGSVNDSVILSYWAPSLLIYVVIITVLAASVTWATSKSDTFWLSIVLSMLNFAFFAWAQAIRQGPQLHGEVSRAAVFGQRLSEVVSDSAARS